MTLERRDSNVTSPGRVLVGVDVGNTSTSGGLVTSEGDILAVVHTATHREGPGTALDTVLAVIAQLFSVADARGLAVEGVGVGLPGLVDADEGVMQSSAGVASEFNGVPLARRISDTAGVATFVDNDVNALALGEWMFGLGRGTGSLVLLAVGSGVGGGVILDGHLVRGQSGSAGEFGHVPIDFDGPRCLCGGRGCLNVYAGGHALAAEARDRVRHEPSSLPALAKGDHRAITAKMVFEAAAGGDALARSLVDRACRALGAGLALVVNSLNPEVVVVTGGVVASLVPLREDIIRHLQEYALGDTLAETRIHLVAADKLQTMRGGAALALYERARRGGLPANRISTIAAGLGETSAEG
jgi:glucokinase